MSRFEETLERDLRQIADRATPSPDAWHQIQLRIADQEPIQETEIIMLTENTLTRRRWPLVAAAAAAVALAVAGIALVARDDGAEVPAEPPPPTAAPETDAAPDTGTDGNAPADEGAGLPAVGEQVEPGRYTTDVIGTPLTVELGEGATAPWTVVANDATGIQLWSDDTAREFVAIGRIGSWFDAEEARSEQTRGAGSIAPNDIDGWISANGIIVVERAEVEVGGRPAQYRQIRLDTTPGATADWCPPGEQPCLWAAAGSADLIEPDSTPIPFARDRLHSIWLVDMDDYEPMIVLGIPNLDDEEGWFADVVQPIVASIELGEPAPAVPGGAARVSTFGAATAPDGLALPRAGGTVEPGRYTSGALGVPIAFDLDVGETATWTVMMEDPGRLWLISTGSDQEFVAIGRLGSWYDATEARTEDTTGLGSIPPDDVDGWIERNGIIVVDRADVEVGGRPAQYVRFRLDTTPGATADFCGSGAPCLWAATGSADVVGGTANPIEVGLDRAQSLWVIDMDRYEPMYVFAAARLGDDGDEQWFADIVQPIVDSIELGDPAPTVEGGTARMPERVTLNATMTVEQTGERDADGPWPVERTGELTGDIMGTYAGTGTSSPNGAEVTLDWTMDATIEGFGSGTLTLRSYWTWSGDGATTTRDVVLSGTGDLSGVTGSGTGVQTSDHGIDNPFTADIELQLAPPFG